MNIINSFCEVHSVYKYTTIILGIQSLIMGITLLVLSRLPKQRGAHGRPGLVFLSIAMFVLSAINLVEFVTESTNGHEQYTLAIVVFAASVEMFLLWSAYMSMISRTFINRKRIYTELGLITVFTVPALLVPMTGNSPLFYTLFVVGIGFYAVKLMFNLRMYRKQVTQTLNRISHHLSDESGKLLGWVNSTFYLVLVIGVVSVVVPMTGFVVLTFYNTFIFFAYSYIYLSVVRNIDVFEQNMAVMEEARIGDDALRPELCPRKESSFIASHQKALSEWIAAKGYAVAGVTASEVASRLNTNRTKLSQYLKNELHLSYYEWIAGLRIEEAKRQLIEYPDRSVYEIALNVGIEDRDNFRRVFLRLVGISPSAYRKAYFEKNLPL